MRLSLLSHLFQTHCICHLILALRPVPLWIASSCGSVYTSEMMWIIKSMMGLIQASKSLLPDTSFHCYWLMASEPYPLFFFLWGGIFYAMEIFSEPCHLVQMVEEPLQKLGNRIHLKWIALLADGWKSALTQFSTNNYWEFTKYK